jgi:cytochrome c peroxidase
MTGVKAWITAGTAIAFTVSISMAVERASALEFTAEEIRKIRQHSPLGPPPSDNTNRFADDPAAAHLGQFLFFDKRLSAGGDVSCATCHDPRLGFANAASKGTGTGGLTTPRHVPTLLNIAYNRWFFWDGRADSAWSQATQPLENPSEHGSDRLQIVHLVSRTSEIRNSYEAVFGVLPDVSDPKRFPAQAAPIPDHLPRARAWKAMSAADQETVNRIFTNLAKAIAAYEQTLMSRDSPFDRFVAQLGSDPPDAASALSESAQRGLRLFIGRGNCRLCHSGTNFSDGEFHDTALPRSGAMRDTGRWGGTHRLLIDPFNSAGTYSDGPKAELRYLEQRQTSSGQFKTPTLRDVERTGPYSHTGQFKTLREVLHFYSSRENIARTHGEQGVIRRLDLTHLELDDLETFLKSLTGRPLPNHLLEAPASPGYGVATE